MGQLQNIQGDKCYRDDNKWNMGSGVPEMGVEFAILNGMARRGLTVKVTNEQNLEGEAGASCVYTVD